MWSTIPYSVLADEEFTSGVGPIRSGSTSLPAKSSTWTTTEGRLTLEDANRRAAALHPLPAQEPYRFLDDRWLKDHPGDKRAEELYLHTQRRSRVLAGKGTGLNSADIEALRT
jgi:hypothetical protein